MGSVPFCPWHLYEAKACDECCLLARYEFRESAHALRVFWWAREKRGEQPMSKAEYRCRYDTPEQSTFRQRRRLWAA